MRTLSLLLVAGSLSLVGCGSSSDAPAQPVTTTGAAPARATTPTTAAPSKPKRTGTRIVLGDSQYGTILFGPRKQAIYIFERDPKGKTVCYDECADAWPPVLTKGEPRAGDGVKQSLLGTVKRRDGSRQVTYAGKPLYSYVNEGPGEVRCHNANENGGFWWVVGPSGKRRA